MATSIIGDFKLSADQSKNIGDFLDHIIELHEHADEIDNHRDFLLECFDEIWETKSHLPPEFSLAVKDSDTPYHTIRQLHDDVLDWIQDGAVEVLSNGKYISPNSVLFELEDAGIDWRSYIKKLDDIYEGKDVKLWGAEFPLDILEVLDHYYIGRKNGIGGQQFRTKFPEARELSEIENPHKESPTVKTVDCLSNISDVELVGKLTATCVNTLNL
jgi:hypothetical protein